MARFGLLRSSFSPSLSSSLSLFAKPFFHFGSSIEPVSRSSAPSARSTLTLLVVPLLLLLRHEVPLPRRVARLLLSSRVRSLCRIGRRRPRPRQQPRARPDQEGGARIHPVRAQVRKEERRRVRVRWEIDCMRLSHHAQKGGGKKVLMNALLCHYGKWGWEESASFFPCSKSRLADGWHGTRTVWYCSR